MSVLWVLIVIAIFGGLNGFLSATYSIPPYYSGRVFQTYLPLMVGVLCSASLSVYIGYRVPEAGRTTLKVSLGICYACVATFLVFSLYMLIVVNIRGE